ncbi:acetyltransferase [Piscinibacterium candidicorallinum]|uniref:Acetyltransferase n=1 Tax=Piscinibacterium candidicorallinum TaxID=1793872 RepID=A0ABV7H9I3_9BURK
MKRYAIYGSSGCGRGVMPLLRAELGAAGAEFDLVFIDDNPQADFVNGHRVLKYEEWIALAASERHVNVAIANSAIRARLVSKCEADGVRFHTVRASNVICMDAVELGEGAILSPFVCLTSNIRIGRHFHANLYSYVEHDCVIGDFVTFAPGVQCNGNVVIEDFAYVGAGAVIKQGQPGAPLTIGRGATIGMGAVVTRSVAPGETVVGNPARLHAKR